MTVRSKLGLLLGLALVLLAAVLVWAALHPEPKPAEAKLRDGAILQLAGISIGSSHSLPQTWRTRASRFAPARLKPLFGPSFSSGFGFGDPGLGLWLMQYDPAASGYRMGWTGQCVAVDEHGCEFPAGGRGSTGDGYYYATIVNFGAYPRRQKNFTCRVLDLQGKTLGELTISNPQVSAAPPWAPSPLPIRLANGPLALTLERFDSPATPRFTVERQGKTEDFWTAENTAFEDASGNRGNSLCRRESAWQWTATLHRKIDAPFAQAEISTLAHAAIPAPGSLVSLPVRLNIGHSTLTNLSLAGPGRYDWSNSVLVASAPLPPGKGGASFGASSRSLPSPCTLVYRSGGRPFLILPNLPVPSPAKLIVRARANGAILGAAESAGSTGNFHFYDLPLNLPPGPIDLDFILDPGYEFSARIAPAEILGFAP